MPDSSAGRIDNYLCELAAQPGGSQGRPDTTAGSKPIAILGRPTSDSPRTASLVSKSPAPVPDAAYLSTFHPPRGSAAPACHRSVCGNALNHARYDGMGNVRALTNTAGATTDSDDHDRHVPAGKLLRADRSRQRSRTDCVHRARSLAAWGILLCAFSPSADERLHSSPPAGCPVKSRRESAGVCRGCAIQEILHVYGSDDVRRLSLQPQSTRAYGC